jgi:hypothetical protein
MVNVRIYVEGGGDGAIQKREFRRGLSNFWEKAGLKEKMPRTIVCGGRNSTFDAFCIAVKTHRDDVSLLLVDSEDPFPPNISKWDFLKKRDQWEKPVQACEKQVYLMIQSMEAWLLADRIALQKYYGSGFKVDALASEKNPAESLNKKAMYDALEKATLATTKKSYSKGGHSFQLIGLVDPQKVMDACPSAKQLIDYLIEIS